jgi:LacI family transcriptional regulator, galactose operon repressor
VGGQVTLDDVARVAGVSRAAASRALNGRNGVRPAVRERVTQASDSLGYRPNRAARNLASGRSAVIGLVIPSDELRVDPYGASMVHSVARAADAADQGLMLFLASSEPGEHIRRNLRDGLIDGVIVSAVAVGERWIEELLDADRPTVIVGAPHPRRSDVPVVGTENRASSAAAVEHLFDQGCERVAIITGPLDRGDGARRLEGYRDAHRRRGVPVDEELVIVGDFNRASGRAAGERLVGIAPDGVFACNDEMALGALAAFDRAGIVVPDQIAVVGFDGTSAAEVAGVSLTTLVQPFDELGRVAVAELLALLAGEPVELFQMLAPRLVVGESSRRNQR